MKVSYIYKIPTFLTIASVVLSGCASPVYVYPEIASNEVHFEKNPTTLNCRQLNEARLQVSALIITIAEEQIENATRSTPTFSAGISISNPITGSDFIGYQSQGVSPDVNEYRKQKVLLEEIEDLQLRKCVRTNLDS
jgi:hypothetical protein